MKKIVFLILALVTAPAACGDDSVKHEPDDGGTDGTQVDAYEYVDECPVEREARWIVHDATKKIVNDLFSVAQAAAEGKYGFYLSLVGINVSVKKTVTLAAGCPHPQELNVNCLSDLSEPGEGFFENRDECYQIVCEDKDLAAIRVYYTMLPHNEFDDPHEFNYPGDFIYGDEFVWNPNPVVVWRHDGRTDGRVFVSADVDRNVTVLFEEGDPLNLKHEGSAEAVIIGDAIDSVNLTMTFPGLSAGPVEVSVNANSEGAPEGTIMLNGEVLAEYDSSGLAWAGKCGP